MEGVEPTPSLPPARPSSATPSGVYCGLCGVDEYHVQKSRSHAVSRQHDTAFATVFRGTQGELNTAQRVEKFFQNMIASRFGDCLVNYAGPGYLSIWRLSNIDNHDPVAYTIDISGPDDFVCPMIEPTDATDPTELARLPVPAADKPWTPTSSPRNNLRFHTAPCVTVPWEDRDAAIYKLRISVQLQFLANAQIDMNDLENWLHVRLQTPGDPQPGKTNRMSYRLPGRYDHPAPRIFEFPVHIEHVGVHPVVLEINVTSSSVGWQQTHIHHYAFVLYAFARSFELIRREILATDKGFEEAEFLPGNQYRYEKAEPTDDEDPASEKQEGAAGLLKPGNYDKWQSQRAKTIQASIQAFKDGQYPSLQLVPHIGEHVRPLDTDQNVKNIVNYNLIPLIDKNKQQYLRNPTWLTPSDSAPTPVKEGLVDDPRFAFASPKLHAGNLGARMANNLLNMKIAQDILNHKRIHYMNKQFGSPAQFRLPDITLARGQRLLMLSVRSSAFEEYLEQPNVTVGAFSDDEAQAQRSYTRLPLVAHRENEDTSVRDIFCVMPSNLTYAVALTWRIFTIIPENRVFSHALEVLSTADYEYQEPPKPKAANHGNNILNRPRFQDVKDDIVLPEDPVGSNSGSDTSQGNATEEQDSTLTQTQRISSRQRHLLDIKNRVLTHITYLMEPPPSDPGRQGVSAGSTGRSPNLPAAKKTMPGECNPPQQKAIETVAEYFPPYSVLFGPPGTGKTLTLGHLVRALFGPGGKLLERKEAAQAVSPHRVLACSATNNATDALARSVLQETASMTDPPVILRIYSRQWLKAAATPTALKAVGRVWDKDLHGTDDIEAAIDKADIIICTVDTAILRYSALLQLTDGFAGFVLDEAGRVGFELAFVLSTLAEATVLGGDFRQLRPYIPEQLAFFHYQSWDISMLQLCRDLGHPFTQLQYNYRSAKKAIQAINHCLYANQIIPAMDAQRCQEAQKLPTLRALFGDAGVGIAIVPVDGYQERVGTSYINVPEAYTVVKILYMLFKEGLTQSVGIISCYKAQERLINRMLQEVFAGAGNRPNIKDQVMVASPERFQGLQRDWIIVTNSRCQVEQYFDDAKPKTGFSTQMTRLDVVLSRSRHGTIIPVSQRTNVRSPLMRYTMLTASEQDCLGDMAHSCPRFENALFLARIQCLKPKSLMNYIVASDTTVVNHHPSHAPRIPIVCTETHLFFFTAAAVPFSNHSAVPVTLSFPTGKIKFHTAEHAYFYLKFQDFGRQDMADRVLRTASPAAVKRLGNTLLDVEGPWYQQGLGLQAMHRVVYQKFIQNAEAREALRRTGVRVLVEASPTDAYWGVGMSILDIQQGRYDEPASPRGLNHLGRLLMEVRSIVSWH